MHKLYSLVGGGYNGRMRTQTYTYKNLDLE